MIVHKKSLTCALSGVTGGSVGSLLGACTSAVDDVSRSGSDSRSPARTCAAISHVGAPCSARRPGGCAAMRMQTPCSASPPLTLRERVQGRTAVQWHISPGHKFLGTAKLCTHGRSCGA